MKDKYFVAVVTTSREQFERYLRVKEVTEYTHKHVSIKRDIEGETFSDSVLVEGHQNVTDWVKNNIVLYSEFNI